MLVKTWSLYHRYRDKQKSIYRSMLVKKWSLYKGEKADSAALESL
jgi:hypothetical protein